eukprot:TRINITY_DN3892_c0_g1_i1.p1 TRINITY_DN3892_c0_g1~~TRINITY_DN3892_c0_g1_i1.p1  ORF type:complete len:153 (-),score=41.47 TRINITY_DN3892_c0_g1_i1:122-547(-)
MLFGALVWLFALFALSGLIFFVVVALVSFSDLDSDYTNPVELCSRLNGLLLPEYALFGAMVVAFLLGGCWIEIVLNLPLLVWFCQAYVRREHRLDPTKVFQQMPTKRMEAYIKLGFFMVSFFFYLYRLVFYLVQGYLDSDD